MILTVEHFFQKMSRARAKGKAFERRVERMLKQMGKSRIRRNVVLKDGKGNSSEIDGTSISFCSLSSPAIRDFDLQSCTDDSSRHM